MFLSNDNWTGQDKLVHFFGCGFLSLVLCGIALYFRYSKVEIAIFSLTCVLFISVAKEVYDCLKPNPTGFSYKDTAWGMGGAILGVVPFII